MSPSDEAQVRECGFQPVGRVRPATSASQDNLGPGCVVADFAPWEWIDVEPQSIATESTLGRERAAVPENLVVSAGDDGADRFATVVGQHNVAGFVLAESQRGHCADQVAVLPFENELGPGLVPGDARIVILACPGQREFSVADQADAVVSVEPAAIRTDIEGQGDCLALARGNGDRRGTHVVVVIWICITGVGAHDGHRSSLLQRIADRTGHGAFAKL